MVIGGYEFERVAEISPVRTLSGVVQPHLPQERYANARRLPLNKYGAGPFCKFSIQQDVR